MSFYNSRIIKSHAVIVDNDNKVYINVYAPPEPEPEPDPEESEPESLFEEGVDAEAPPEEQAEAIIQNARRKAETLLQEAREEAESLLAEAKEKAAQEGEAILESTRKQGYQEGIDSAEAEGEQIKSTARQVLDDAERDKLATEAALEPEMVGLITGITEKLLGDAARINPQVILFLIRQGLSGATMTGEVSVRVSPHDYQLVADNRDSIFTMADGSIQLEIVKDLSLNAMDCVIETPYGNIDCSLGQQFETLRDNLTYILGS